jgi:hypothetical protein
LEGQESCREYCFGASEKPRLIAPRYDGVQQTQSVSEATRCNDANGGVFQAGYSRDGFRFMA